MQKKDKAQKELDKYIADANLMQRKLESMVRSQNTSHKLRVLSNDTYNLITRLKDELHECKKVV